MGSGSMRTAFAAMLLLLVPFALLAGCLSCVSGPPVTARGIESADASGGLRGFSLDVLVTDGPGGPPMPGAGVVVYYGRADVGDWEGPRVDVGGPGGSVHAGAGNFTGTAESTNVLRLLTGEDGVATARVPGNRIVGVVAARDGFTEEWIPAAAAGDTGASGRVVMPLFRAAIETSVDAVWSPGGASSGVVTDNNYLWDPHELPFGDTAESRRGYAARALEIDITLNWTNGASGAGDLAVGIGGPGSQPGRFEDGGRNAGVGEQSERAVFDLAALEASGALGSPAIMAGAASETGFAAPFGLPYTMHVRALFDTAQASLERCLSVGEAPRDAGPPGASVPAAGVVTLLAVLAAAAFVTRPQR